MLVERWLTSSFEDRESALISRKFGVPGFFILLLYWNLCSYRLEMGVSGKLWIVAKDVRHLLYMMWNERRLWIQWRGNVLHLELIWGKPINFAFLRWHQCSSRLMTGFGDFLVFNQANRGSLRVWLGKRNCSGHNAGESGLISQGGESLMGFLELRQEPGVYSRVTAGMSIRNSSLFIKVRNLSRYEGQLRNVN